MLLWNRREVLVTNSQERFAAAGEVLAQNGIKYEYSVKNSNMTTLGDSRGRNVDRNMQNPNVYNLYYLYVHKNDAERAKHLLSE